MIRCYELLLANRFTFKWSKCHTNL